MARASQLPTGTVTFLFTDIEGSTGLLQTLGREHYAELLARHNELLRSTVGEHGGTEVDTQGDAFFAAFPTPSAALTAAAQTQRAFLAEAWPAATVVSVRMGIHTGEVDVGSEGYVGLAVHQAARVAAVAQGGQILVTQATARLVEQELPDGFSLHELGRIQLAGLERPVAVAALEVEGLPRPRDDRRAPLRTGQRTAPALLDRDTELATLRDTIAAARAGEGRLVLIEGSAGIGKSRLLVEARTIASGHGMQVLSSRAGEHESEFAFGVVRQLFEPLLVSAPADQRAELVAGAAALVEPLFPATRAATAAAPDDSPFAIQHGLFWLAANIAYAQPTCLIVDDLHWADAPSLQWLGYLVRRLDGLPLTVVAATRPPEQGHDPTLLDGLLDDPATVIVHPAPLTLGSITELTRERLGREPADAFCAAVAVATGGNPLYVTALLDTAAREHVEPTAQQARQALELGPRAISRAVSIRLARLPADAIAIARAAAILGDGGELRHVAALADLDLVPSGRAATRLVRVDLLRSADPIEFFHPVVRSALYDTIDAGTRIDLHRRAAEILTAAGAPPEQAAGHLLQVAPAADASVIAVLRNAARRAQASGAHAAAVGYLRRAVAEPPEGHERFDVLLELGLSERRIGAPEALERIEAARDAADNPVRRAHAGLEYGRTLFFANRPADAIAALGRAADELGDTDPDLKERFDAEIIGSARWLADHSALANERLAAIDEATLHGGAGSAQLLAALAVDEAARSGSRERATRRARQALVMGVLQDEGAIGFYHAVNALIQAGETEEAYVAYAQAVQQARRQGDPFALSNLLGFVAYVRLRLGDLLDADADLREGLELSRAAAGDSLAFQWHTGTLAEVLIERGELEEARAVVDSANLDDQSADNMQLFFLRSARGKLRLAAREPELALADFQTILTVADAGGTCNPNWVPARSMVALALHHLGRDAEAKTLIEEELGFARSWGAPVGIAVSLRALGLVTGGAEGLARLAEAASMLEGTPSRLEHARTLVEYGAALRRSNQRTDARDRLREGADLAQRLGALALVEQANEELAATGARPRRLLQTGLETLTASERRVAQLAAQDLTNKDIAQALFVTVKTVEVHLSSVYRKLEITSRRQLAAALAEPADPAVR